jgi:cysteinyl-tRNA synthetase
VVLAANLSPAASSEPSPEVLALLAERQAARTQREWASADMLRQRIAQLGWQVLDTPGGPQLEQIL